MMYDLLLHMCICSERSGGWIPIPSGSCETAFNCIWLSAHTHTHKKHSLIQPQQGLQLDALRSKTEPCVSQVGCNSGGAMMAQLLLWSHSHQSANSKLATVSSLILPACLLSCTYVSINTYTHSHTHMHIYPRHLAMTAATTRELAHS